MRIRRAAALLGTIGVVAGLLGASAPLAAAQPVCTTTEPIGWSATFVVPTHSEAPPSLEGYGVSHGGELIVYAENLRPAEDGVEVDFDLVIGVGTTEPVNGGFMTMEVDNAVIVNAVEYAPAGTLGPVYDVHPAQLGSMSFADWSLDLGLGDLEAEGPSAGASAGVDAVIRTTTSGASPVVVRVSVTGDAVVEVPCPEGGGTDSPPAEEPGAGGAATVRPEAGDRGAVPTKPGEPAPTASDGPGAGQGVWLGAAIAVGAVAVLGGGGALIFLLGRRSAER